MMNKYIKYLANMRNEGLLLAIVLLILQACVPSKDLRKENISVPENYSAQAIDTTNTANISWKEFFADPYLGQLIDTALANNQELNIMLQQVQMVQNEIKARKGEYLPFVDIYGGAEIEKVGEFTRNGAVEKNLPVKEEEAFPEPLSNYAMGLAASWELDVWKKLRNAKKAALMEYLASVEGKNFMVTQLVAEIANSYYELMALDNQLAIIEQNLEIQQNALTMVRLQKQAARVNELAVRRFEAEVLKNKSHRYEILQEVVETENRINFLLGRSPQPIARSSEDFIELKMADIHAGIPSQLLLNRPDIRRAELELKASKLNTKVARANFYPSLGIKAGMGLSAFNTKYLTSTPESIVYSLVGDVVGPLINRNAIKAAYQNANASQLQAIFEYEKSILNGYIEVSNQLSNLENLKQNYDLKVGQVQALTESIDISLQLFKSARADYMEVLLVQREALESKIELVETKKSQLMAQVNIYQSLGGGWN
jgi:NodT family efflux transporter outer membrane factor (OMF) lipoprotein